MAVLKNASTGDLRPVPARLLIGRSRASGLRLDSALASGEHATLRWTGTHWEIRDLGSRNGTFVDGKRVDAGRAVTLGKGAKLTFGANDEAWVLEDDDAPSALAIDTRTGEVRTATDGLLVLPSADTPEISVYRDKSGAWVAESADGDVRAVEEAEVVVAGGASWRLHLPIEAEGTPMVEPGPTLGNVRFRFAVSANEERVDISVLHGKGEIALESREHGYVLLTLARARQEDAALSPGERGWVDRDELLKMLGTDVNGLNVAIHRARQQLLAAGVEGAEGIVEVRRGLRRFGTDRFEIVPM